MRKLLILLLTLSAITSAVHWPVSAWRLTTTEQKLNQLNSTITLDTDAVKAKVAISSSSGWRETKEIILAEHEDFSSKNIPLKLPKDGHYQLTITLYDEVLNATTIEQRLSVDSKAPELILGEIYICEQALCAEATSSEAIQLNLRSNNLSGSWSLAAGQKQLLKFAEPWWQFSTLDLLFSATDSHGNISTVSKRINLTGLLGETGSVFGVTSANPWGESANWNSYVANLEFLGQYFAEGSGSKLNDYWVRSANLPQPVLTTMRRDAQGYQVFGRAPSKQTYISGQLVGEFPSIYTAEQVCLAELWNYPACIARTAGYFDYSSLTDAINSQCGQLWPIDRFLCDHNFRQQRRSSYRGLATSRLEHVLVELYDQRGQLLASRWQETDDKFQFPITEQAAATASYLQVKVSVFGNLKVAGETLSYNSDRRHDRQLVKLHSYSTFLSLQEHLVKLTTESTCRNLACKVIDTPYFNQAVNEQGKWESWANWPTLAGGQSCGAASATMALGAYSKFDSSLRLKSFVFQDNRLQLKNKACGRPGIFAVTASDSSCNQSAAHKIQQLAGQFNVATQIYWPSGNPKGDFERIRSEIDRGNLVLLSYRKPIGHILLIHGYTYGEQLVVHDPYRDIQNNYRKGIYDYSGKDALYRLVPNSSFQLNYFMVFKR